MKKTSQLLFGLAALALVSFINPVKDLTYKVDTQQSKLVWTGKKVTGEHTGLAPISDGTVLVEGSKLKGGSFEINLSALTVTDVTDPDGNAKLVGHLKADDFFGVAKHPKATFVITKVQPISAGTYDVTGNLTIKGITNTVTFPTKVTTSGDKLTATAKITVDRTKYDIKFRSKSFFENLGDKTIYDDFTLDLNLVATPVVLANAKTGR